jgi:hypothetical protein
VLVEGDLKKQIVVDCLIPENVSRFPWGGHLGLQMLQPVIDEIEQARRDAGLHQHPLAVGALVPEPDRGASRLGRPGGAASRFARPRGARMGRDGPEERRAEGGGLHRQPGPGRGLPAGRARAADRQRQGHRAPAAAGRAQRPCAGAHLARDPGADQQPGTAGSGRRQARRRHPPHRGAAGAQQTLRRAGAAPGDGGAGRRLPRTNCTRKCAAPGPTAT